MPWKTCSRALSPTQPNANEAKVIPNCVADK